MPESHVSGWDNSNNAGLSKVIPERLHHSSFPLQPWNPSITITQHEYTLEFIKSGGRSDQTGSEAEMIWWRHFFCFTETVRWWNIVENDFHREKLLINVHVAVSQGWFSQSHSFLSQLSLLKWVVIIQMEHKSNTRLYDQSNRKNSATEGFCSLPLPLVPPL